MQSLKEGSLCVCVMDFYEVVSDKAVLLALSRINWLLDSAACTLNNYLVPRFCSTIGEHIL